MNCFWKRVVLISVLVVMMSTWAMSAPTLERRRYQEKKQDRVLTAQWRLSKTGNGYALLYIKAGERHVTRTDNQLRTLSWTMEENTTDTRFEAVRTGDIIMIHGRYQGKPVEKKLTVDSDPWYQATSLSLSRLALSDDTYAQFWTLHPKTQDAYKLKALRLGKEILALDGVFTETLKLELRLTGLLAPFWKSWYWFDLETGTFVRFEGKGGATDRHPTVITLISKERP